MTAPIIRAVPSATNPGHQGYTCSVGKGPTRDRRGALWGAVGDYTNEAQKG